MSRIVVQYLSISKNKGVIGINFVIHIRIHIYIYLYFTYKSFNNFLKHYSLQTTWSKLTLDYRSL